MSQQIIPNYNFKETESRWQALWDAQKTFAAVENSSKKKYYVLEMFPYPSGKIHMGHLRNYTLGDVVARYKRAQGYNVLHPMGWDSFGLPAENAAIENNVHPAKWTYENIAHMRKQLKKIGFSYDWDREVATCSPEYYQHEQKMFLDFLKAGIAYQKDSMVNWDPVDNTVLANEQVVDGRGWRSGAIVERRKLRQWFLKISDFAEDLLEGLKTLENWPEKVRLMQERWIGKSSGLRIFFEVKGRAERLEVYTTRPDTIFGASFCAISPNHPLASELAEKSPEIKAFIEECNKMGMAEEIIEKAEKKGVDTGLKIMHPFIEGAELPLYVANFVLMDYGSGAIFACPAHDQRDLDFARKYNLPVTVVVAPEGQNVVVENEAYTENGILVNSQFLNGMTVEAAKQEISNRIEKRGHGKATINFRLRDWGISRQRYWGCPIPIIYCDTCGAVPVPEKDLPVTLPEDVDLTGIGNPLARHPSWKHVNCPTCDKPAVRETDTFDTFFESSWYFARFCSPDAANGIDKNKADYWLPVDQYIGGVEHAVLHLLYARFFTRALAKCGYVGIKEPFAGLLTQGMVCLETYQDKNDKWLFPEEVRKEKDKSYHVTTGEEVTVGRSQKMSKSKKNVVDPDHIVNSYGADTARLFMLSDSPPERDLEWSDSGVEGAWRYLNRLWKLVVENKEFYKPNDNLLRDHLVKFKTDDQVIKIRRLTHKTIKAVTSDLNGFHFNKAIARIREFSNAIEDEVKRLKSLEENLKRGVAEKLFDNPTSINTLDNTQSIAPALLNLAVFSESIDMLIKLIQPMIPHIAEELWLQLGHKEMLVDVAWPVADKTLVVDDTVTIAVQINGKLKVALEIGKDLPKEEVEKIALANEKVKIALEGKEVRKVIIVPNRIVNVVV